MNFLLFLPIVWGSFLSEDDVKSKHLKQHVIRQFAPFIGSVQCGRQPSALRTLAKLYKPGWCIPNDKDSKDEKTKKIVCCYAHHLHTYTTDQFIPGRLKELDVKEMTKKLNTAYETSLRANAKKQESELEQLFSHAYDFEQSAMRLILSEVLSKDKYRSFLSVQKDFHLERNGALGPFGYDLAVLWAQREKVELESDDDLPLKKEEKVDEGKKVTDDGGEIKSKNEPSQLRLVLTVAFVVCLIGLSFYIRFVFIPNMTQKAAMKIRAKLDSQSA